MMTDPNGSHPSIYPYLAAMLLSMLGTGISQPFVAIYIANEAQVWAASSYFAILAITALVTNPLWAARMGRSSARSIVVSALGLQVLGTAALASSATPVVIFAAAVITGVGNSGFYAAQTPLLKASFDGTSLKKLFGLQYMAMNVGLALGGALAGIFVGLWGSGAAQGFIAANSVSFVGLAIWAIARGSNEVANLSKDGGSGLRSVVQPYRDRAFVKILLIQVLVVGAGLSQFSSVVPFFITEGLGLPVVVVSVTYVVNCIAVVAIQPLAIRFSEGRRAYIGVATAAGVWCVAYLVGWCSMFWGVVGGAITMSVVAIVFALGETLVSANLQPLVVEAAPEGHLGAYSAAVSQMYSVGVAVGPALGLGLVAARSSVYWPALFVGAAMIVALAVMTGRRQPTPRAS